MEKVVIMTEVDKDRKPILKSIDTLGISGILNQQIFNHMKDAIYSILCTAQYDTKITIDKYDDTFVTVVVECGNKKTYYELSVEKPVSYE
jgi:hypothetical protein